MPRFHQLTLVETLPERWRNNVVGLWRCDCGKEKKLPMFRVKSGHAKSCGCLKLKHGGAARGTKTAEYTAWLAMHSRCNATEGRDAKTYRERGITVCERWQAFENFLADMGKRLRQRIHSTAQTTTRAIRPIIADGQRQRSSFATGGNLWCGTSRD